MENSRVSIRAVAAEAAVSATTVSHVLNDVPGKRIAPETRERVKDAAARLGYVPNGVARQLRARRSWTLGLVSDEIMTTPFATGIVRGALEVAHRHGLLLLLLDTGLDRDRERRDLSALLQGRVDGVLYARMYHQEAELPAELLRVPTVLVDAVSNHPEIPSVVPDEFGGAYAATTTLVRAGHRDIAFVTDSADIPATRGRLAGYRAALADAGLAVDPRHITHIRPNTSQGKAGYEAATHMLASIPRPTGVFCYNDRIAMGVYQAAATLGLAVPDDLSIVGFDNQLDIADGLHPGLTTMALPHEQMGAWAVEALLALMGDASTTVERAVLPCPLVERASVAPPPAAR